MCHLLSPLSPPGELFFHLRKQGLFLEEYARFYTAEVRGRSLGSVAASIAAASGVCVLASGLRPSPPHARGRRRESRREEQRTSSCGMEGRASGPGAQRRPIPFRRVGRFARSPRAPRPPSLRGTASSSRLPRACLRRAVVARAAAAARARETVVSPRRMILLFVVEVVPTDAPVVVVTPPPGPYDTL